MSTPGIAKSNILRNVFLFFCLNATKTLQKETIIWLLQLAYFEKMTLSKGEMKYEIFGQISEDAQS